MWRFKLIRNAVCTACESTAERETTGKPANATLRLEFKGRAGKRLELMFQDDGRGLDPGKVRDVAVAKGIVTEEEASRLRDRQVIKLISNPGYDHGKRRRDQTWQRHVAGAPLCARSGRQNRAGQRGGKETRFKSRYRYWKWQRTRRSP